MSRSAVITWSPSVTLVPTRACFNACGYCGFRRPVRPEELAGAAPADNLSDATARQQLASRPGAREVLLLSGELPPGSGGRAAWFARLRRLSQLALAAGRLPHTNAGPLSRREMAALGRLNPSLGLMLEGLGAAFEQLHRGAPSKRLDLRLAQLEQAGRLGIPFTTGLLLGVGEQAGERRDALRLIALLQRRWGHIQEVILQPWRPGGAAPAPLPAGLLNGLLTTVAEARRILPPEVHLQLPPNLWPADRLGEALEAGIDDLGGIDSGDVINPAYPQPAPPQLARLLERQGWRLQPRLCVHRHWIPWLPSPLRRRAEAIAQALAGAG
ncbi:MAG: 7,8-didemethyl-8-hydroxy-5-deazariboflavin synthase subunit CofG [Cyanobacteria bacterium J06638_7]